MRNFSANFILAIAFIIIPHSLKAQEYSVKGRVLSDLYTTHRSGVWFYNINGAYGLTRRFDLGIGMGVYSGKYYKGYWHYFNGCQIHFDMRYYFTPLLFKKTTNIDLYLKGSAGYLWSISNDTHRERQIYTGYLGFRYFPFKRIGVMAEAGMDILEPEFLFGFGLSFKLKL